MSQVKLADVAKLRAIADIARTLSDDEMVKHETCAMGASVAAGILSPSDRDYVATPFFAKSLGITQAEAEHAFLMLATAHHGGRRCADYLLELAGQYERAQRRGFAHYADLLRHWLIGG